MRESSDSISDASQKRRRQRFCEASLTGHDPPNRYLGVSTAAASPAFLRLPQLYLRWNFSTRPVVSTNFILPVKNGWQAEQISTVMFFLVLRVVNLLPQPQVTVASSYFGWMSFFMARSGEFSGKMYCRTATHAATRAGVGVQLNPSRRWLSCL